MRTVAFRVVQEAVTNALRHAAASEIRVSLRLDGEHLAVTIEDNGSGFDPHETQRRIRRGEHLGLLGLTERVHGAGGEIEVSASPGSGSRISVRIPR
jgi:signal transduction histidine kinase